MLFVKDDAPQVSRSPTREPQINSEYGYRQSGDNSVLNIEQLSVSVESNENTSQILANVDLSVAPGQRVGLSGPSGSGKSTLLRCALGLPPKSFRVSGKVELFGKPLLDDLETRLLRRKLAVVFQDPFQHFAPDVIIGKQMELMVEFRQLKGVVELDKRLLQLMSLLRMEHPGRLLSAYPRELSGGQLQRLQIVAALLVNPRFIVVDEPTSSVDPVNADLIGQVLVEHCTTHGTPLLLASHDQALLQRVCHVTYGIPGRAKAEEGT